MIRIPKSTNALIASKKATEVQQKSERELPPKGRSVIVPKKSMSPASDAKKAAIPAKPMSSQEISKKSVNPSTPSLNRKSKPSTPIRSTATSRSSSAMSLASRISTKSTSSLSKRPSQVLDLKKMDHEKGAISLILIAKRNLVNSTFTNEDQFQKEVSVLTHVRLDREGIARIPEMSTWFTNLTHLYLQHNSIQRLENLDMLPKLRFLILSDNQLSTIHGLKECYCLEVLDLSRNQIQDADETQCPLTLEYLFLQDNPCAFMPDYRLKFITTLVDLKEMDDTPVSAFEKRMARSTHDDEAIEERGGEEYDTAIPTESTDEQWATRPEIYESSIQQLFQRSQERRNQALTATAKKLEALKLEMMSR